MQLEVASGFPGDRDEATRMARDLSPGHSKMHSCHAGLTVRSAAIHGDIHPKGGVASLRSGS